MGLSESQLRRAMTLAPLVHAKLLDQEAGQAHGVAGASRLGLASGWSETHGSSCRLKSLIGLFGIVFLSFSAYSVPMAASSYKRACRHSSVSIGQRARGTPAQLLRQ